MVAMADTARQIQSTDVEGKYKKHNSEKINFACRVLGFGVQLLAISGGKTSTLKVDTKQTLHRGNDKENLHSEPPQAMIYLRPH